MPQVLTKKTPSPLDQVRRGKRVALVRSAQQLSETDQRILTGLLASECDYVANELFAQPDASVKIFDEAPAIARPDTSWYHPLMENLTPDVRVKTANVLLTALQERALFLQFNYCRYMVATLKNEIGTGAVKAGPAREMLEWHRKSEAYRDQIAQTNLALVLAMAKRTRMSEVDFSDLVSEGNMALLRAIDKFDVARGFKFSTYACRAILKAFSRSGVKLSKYRQLFPTDFDPKLEKSDFMQKKREGHEDDCVDELRLIIKDNRAELTDIEQEVIEHRFALGKRVQLDPEASPLTLEQVGKIIGVTKERVRQIQNKALEKIRQTLESDYLG
jgi:RNA polymerase sigma factor (sigma-70 family)